MSDLLMTTWDGAGVTPPMMSVAHALVERGHDVRVLADPLLRADVEAAGAEHVSWTRAPHRSDRGRHHFIEDWGATEPGEGFTRMRDRLTVGPASAFAADVREELDRRPAAAVLTELLLFGPQVAAEGAGVPCIVLGATINVVPAPGVPPFGMGLMPPATEEERREQDELAAQVVAAWDEALPALNTARAEHGLGAARARARPGPERRADARDDEQRLRLRRPAAADGQVRRPAPRRPRRRRRLDAAPRGRPARPRRAQLRLPGTGGSARADRRRGRRRPGPLRRHDGVRDRSVLLARRRRTSRSCGPRRTARFSGTRRW